MSQFDKLVLKIFVLILFGLSLGCNNFESQSSLQTIDSLGVRSSVKVESVDSTIEGSNLTLSISLSSPKPYEVHWQYSATASGEYSNLNLIGLSVQIIDASEGYYRAHIREFINSRKTKDIYTEPTQVTFTPLPVNQAPIAANSVLSLEEGGSMSFQLIASDADGDSLTYTIASQASHGSISNFNAATGTGTYTPNADYFGTDSFSFYANDGTVNSNISTVNIQVNETYVPNIAPVTANSLLSLEEGGSISFQLIASDADGDTLTYTITSQASHGSISNFDAATGTGTYTPNADYFGTDSFSFYANDGTVNSNISTVNIQVNETYVPNIAPIAINSSLSLDEGGSISFQLIASDADGDTLTYTITSQASHGSISNFNAASGTGTYTPTQNYFGADSFSFYANDGTVNSNVSTVSIQINEVVDPDTAPVIQSVSGSPSTINENQTSSLSVVATDDGGAGGLSYQWSTEQGSFDDPNSANPIYTPANVNSTRIVTLSVSVSDGVNSPVVGTVDITVQNQEPDVPYRTVVIFGDTQSATSTTGGSISSGGRYQTFKEQIDWVINNRDSENIDFVLQVGDMINMGIALPLPVTCNGAVKTTPIVTCSAETTANSCGSVSGCYWDSGSNNCSTCAVSDWVEPEWARFRSQWSRLEPGGDLTHGVPFALVQGNHDNTGVEVPNDTDVRGWNQYYNRAYWEGLEAGYAGGNRAYEHISTYSSASEGAAHAWQFQLGDEPILIVGSAYQGGQNISQNQIDWVINTMNTSPTTAAALLAHDLVEYPLLRQQTADVSATVVPNLFATFSGHIGNRGNTKQITTNGTEQVLEIITDRSYAPESERNYITIVRFYMEEGRVESFDFDPSSGLTDPEPSNRILNQNFSVNPSLDDPPLVAPYDLGALPAIVSDTQWPIPPTLSSTATVTNCSEFAAAASTDGGDNIVTAGDYNCSINVSCDDCRFSLADDAEIIGALTFSGHRIHWIGGKKSGNGGVTYSGPQATGDLLIDNLHAVSDFSVTGSSNNFTGNPSTTWHRIAIINTTLQVINGQSTGGWAFFVQQPYPVGSTPYTGESLILANVKLLSDAQNQRIQRINNVVVVDSYYNADGNSTNGLRLHHGVNDIYMRDTIAVGLSPNTGTDTQITNGIFERLTRYDFYQSVFLSLGTRTVNVTINDSQTFINTSGTLQDVPPNLGVATGTNPNMQPWDGVTLPSSASYGADH